MSKTKLSEKKFDSLMKKYSHISFMKSGGAGGQNVNKRNTGVRISSSAQEVERILWEMRDIPIEEWHKPCTCKV